MRDIGIASMFAPELSHIISELINEGKVGICRGLIRVADVNTGCSSSTNLHDRNMDRVTAVLPFAGCSITWEIVFNSHYPEVPPDFIFGPDDGSFEPDIDNLKHLLQWEARDPRCLLRVLDELLAEYQRHHQEILKQHSRLTFEYDSLINELNLRAHEIEVHITKKEHRVGPVNFLIKLPVDFSRIPAYLTKDNPGEDLAVLLVSFQTQECMKATPQLYLSPRVEHVLGGASTIKIPAFQTGGCLIDYIPAVSELLEKKIEQVVLGYEKKRDYVGAVLAHFGRSVMEYDAETFSAIHILLNWHDFFFHMSFELPPQFPTIAPTITFTSVYHEADGKPYTKALPSYPYSPRWSATQMLDRLKADLFNYIPTFQKESVTEGSL